MCECAIPFDPMASVGPSYAFAAPTGGALTARFDAGRLTSDGGLPWLAVAERAVGVCAALAACVPEWRRGPVHHSLETLVRQRVFQIACGYADQDDADTLRSDPLLKLVCGRLPVSGADLASQPTFSRLENAVDRRAIEALAEALVTVYLRERGQPGPAHPRAPRPRWDRRPRPRPAGGGRLPWLLSPAYVPSLAGLRRGYRPDHHRHPAPGQRPRQPLRRPGPPPPAAPLARRVARGHGRAPRRQRVRDPPALRLVRSRAASSTRLG